MKTAELTGAQLDYYAARADGIPARQLKIIPVPRTENLIAVWQKPGREGSDIAFHEKVMAYSTNWEQGGPLVDKFRPDLMPAIGGRWWASVAKSRFVQGDTALQAICRAIVLDKFGEEVGEVEVTP